MKRLILVSLLLAGCKDSPKPSSPTQPPPVPTVAAVAKETVPLATKPEPKVYTREEFRNLVWGKTKYEVVKAVGKADKTEDRPIGNEYLPVWSYYRITQDPFAKNPDSVVEITFGDGINPDKQLRVNNIVP